MAVPVVIKLQVEGGKVVQSEIRGIGDAADGSFRKLGEGSRRASQDLKQAGVATSELQVAFQRLGQVAVGAFALDMGRRIIEIGDAYQGLRDRVALAAGGMEAGAEAQRRIFEVAQQTRQPIQDMTDLFAKVGGRAREMGLSMNDQIAVIQMVGQSLALNKTSAGAAAGGIQQFAQMMGGAKVQAEEFNSIMDAMPPLAEAMAKGLLGAGATVADLKAKIEAGLAPSDLIRGMLTQLDELDGRFGQIGKTVAEVRTQVENQLFQTTGSIMSTSGATNELVGAMEKLLAAVSDPAFGEGLRFIVGQFVDLFTNVTAGVAESVKQIEAWKETISGIVGAVTGIPETFREAHPVVAGIFDGWAEKAGLLQTLVLRMNEQMSGSFRETAAEMSALYQQAVSGQQMLNFAGGSNFRAAQDAGTENAASKMAFVAAPQMPKAIPSPFTPVARPQDKADAAYAAQADKAASAAERALSEAQKIFARDEAAINDMLRQTYAAVDDRSKFVNTAVARLSEVATDDQIGAMREAAGAAYEKAEMDKYSADQAQRKQQIEQAGAATTREFATATEVFAQKMLELRTQLEAGAISQETYNRAAKAASESAQRSTKDANEATKKSYDETYSEISQIVDRTYQGISAGLAAMIVKGEADFGTFVEGMAQSLLQSGLQALMTGLIGGGTAGPGLLFGGGTTTPTPAAHGHVFDGGNVIPFARGGIVSAPTIFPMARGAGLMGEAGPEAVMPLRRLPSGDLGVAAGGGAAPQITITLVNEGRTQLRAEQQRGADGNFKVMLREIIGAEIGTPGTPGHMATRGVVQRYGNGR